MEEVAAGVAGETHLREDRDFDARGLARSSSERICEALNAQSPTRTCGTAAATRSRPKYGMDALNAVCSTRVSAAHIP